jgi:adenylate kinase family enzyme
MTKIILFRGKAGTGKSTLSNELAKRVKIPVLHKDDIYDSVASFVLEHGLRNKICFDFLYRFFEGELILDTVIPKDIIVENIQSFLLDA